MPAWTGNERRRGDHALRDALTRSPRLSRIHRLHDGRRPKKEIYFFTTVILAPGPLFARKVPSLLSISAVRVPMRITKSSW